MDTQEIRDLVEDATRYHGTPWRRVVTSDGGFYGVTDRNGAVVAGSPAVTALIAQAPTLIPELLDRLEQAEEDRDKLMNRLDAMRRQRDGYRNQLRKAEQQIQRVRELHERIPVAVNGRWEIDHCKFCYEQDFSSNDAVWPCPTIRALDGDGRG